MALWTNVDEEAGKPVYLSTADKAKALGIDIAEAQEASVRAMGIKTPGWHLYSTYTDCNGSVRHKAETLVAFAGNMTGDADSIGVAPVISITTQPAAIEVVEGATATFTVVAAVTGTSTLSYQWQLSTDGGTTFEDIVDATAASFTTTALDFGSNDDQYQVVVSGTNGAADVTSTAAVLTITPTVISITTEPVAATVDAGLTAEFTVVAETDPAGLDVTYQWQKAEAETPTVFADIDGATAATYTTDATVFATDNGDVYRVNVSRLGATTVTSAEVVLTVNDV